MFRCVYSNNYLLDYVGYRQGIYRINGINLNTNLILNNSFFIRYFSVNINNKYSVNDKKNIDKKKKVFYSHEGELFKEMKNLLDNNPLNIDTQKKIELSLFDNGNIGLSDDNLKIYEIIGRIDDKLKNLLINSWDELFGLIENFKSRGLYLKYKGIKIKTKNNLVSFYLSEILEKVKIENVVKKIMGKYLVIMNNWNDQNIINTGDVFIDLGNGILNLYFYELYLIEKKIKLKESREVKSDKNNELENIYNMWVWRQENKELLERFNNEIIHGIGALLADWLIHVKLLELSVEDNLKESNKHISVVVPTLKIKDILKLKSLLILPKKIPMIVKPNNYERIFNGETYIEKLGGYLLNGECYSKEIIIKNWRSMDNSKINDINNIYNAINNLSSVPYKINKNVLNFIRLNDSRFNLTLNNGPLHEIEMKKEENIKLLKREKIELEKYTSKKFVEQNILLLADLFENIPEFYIPVRMDYRGRIYCEVEYLNYQSTELAKSLLIYARGEKIFKNDINSIDYLKIFGANCYGNKLDKSSFNDRINWVDENIDNIRNFENGILISKAESKYMFIAFCFEYNRWLDCLENSDSAYFITYLPIQLDASCNGYQHISMLVKDIEMAEHLNLIKSDRSEIPQDFYSFIASFLYEYFNINLKNNELEDEDRQSLERLKVLEIQRSIIKKAIMTIPYNASSIQLIKYLQEPFEYDDEKTKLEWEKNKTVKNIDNDSNESHFSCLTNDEKINVNKLNKILKKNKKEYWYKHRDNNNIKLEAKDFINLYYGLKYILEKVSPSLSTLSNYFKEIANICSKLGINILWNLPTGLEAVQSYMEIKEKRVTPMNYSKNTFSLKIPVRGKLDKEKQMRALMPNLIHSLDASSLVLLVDKYFNEHITEVKNIYAIHDCFAVTANNMEYIIYTLKLVYISLYKDKGYLKKRFPKFYDRLVDIVFIYLTFSMLLTLYKNNSFTNLSEIIGKQILWYLYINQVYTKVNYSDFISLNNMNKENVIKLGDFFIRFLVTTEDKDNLFIEYLNEESNIYYIKINEKFTQFIVDNIIIHSHNLPMISSPAKWSETEYGGYLINKLKKDNIITGSTFHKHQTDKKDRLYNCVNYLNNIKFRINKNLFNYLNNDGKFLIEYVKSEDPKNFINIITSLELAKVFLNIPFYLLHKADWRGRLYVQSSYLNYQANDLSSALLEFDKGEKLNDKGLEYFKIYGANCYGLDKLTFEDRLYWIDQNIENIKNMDKNFILKADSPFLFASFCLNFKKFLIDENYAIRIPIFLDATCSGIQHFSGLLLDHKIGEQVNLTNSNERKDIYLSLVPVLNKAINSYGIENPYKYANLALVKLTRKEFKSLIMTKTYNVTTFGMKEQLSDKFEIETINVLRKDKKGKEYTTEKTLYHVPSINNNTIKLDNSELMKIAQIVNDNIFTEYPSLNEIYIYLKSVANILSKLNLPISWKTPSGLKLTQHYLESYISKISINFLKIKRTKVIRKMDENKICISDQRNAIIPNIIHSFDASHLMNIINHYINTDQNILGIHDCFGTHPNNMLDLGCTVRKEFILLYIDKTFLKEFHNKFLKDIESAINIYKENKLKYILIEKVNKDEKIYLPNLPKMGKLELEKIKDSKYIIC
uniref:DNA-directed RNA polymerase n=1 Tax=Arthrobotrys musiformis TaxID=47236 RepID=A0A482EA67_9PEZI|nr:hypothetical protein [Arthrobotrys musiformis]QBM31531.1 hypothetical protein [Arthrobotrys musiformis]QBM31681.1 hypothetical protein [Arthrobotrys musiformis]